MIDPRFAKVTSALAEGVTVKFEVNPTQVSDQMTLPAFPAFNKGSF